MSDRGQALGPLCITWARHYGGQPLVDSGWTSVEKWGEGTHGSICIRVSDTRMVVVTWRGSRAPHYVPMFFKHPRLVLWLLRKRGRPAPSYPCSTDLIGGSAHEGFDYDFERVEEESQ